MCQRACDPDSPPIFPRATRQPPSLPRWPCRRHRSPRPGLAWTFALLHPIPPTPSHDVDEAAAGGGSLPPAPHSRLVKGGDQVHGFPSVWRSQLPTCSEGSMRCWTAQQGLCSGSSYARRCIAEAFGNGVVSLLPRAPVGHEVRCVDSMPVI